MGTQGYQHQRAASVSQSVQTQMTGLTAGMSTGGNTSGTTGLVSNQLVFVGGNNVTLSQSVSAQSATLTISAFNQSLQTEMTGLSAGMSTGGNTSGTTGLVSNRLVFVGGDNITLSQSVNANSATITISGATAAPGAAGSNTLGMSNLGNTSGTTGVVSGSAIRYLFAGGNNVTLLQSIDAASLSGTVTISAANSGTAPPIATAVNDVATAGSTGTITRFAPEDHRHRGLNQFQITGNTSNTSNLVYGSLYLAGGNNITLSQVSGAGAATVTISAGAGGGGLSAGMSTEGNTAGTTGLVSGRLVIVGSNNITLSQSVNGQSATLSIIGPNPGGGAAPTLSLWVNQDMGSTANSSLSNAALVLWPIAPANDIFPGNMTPSTIFLNLTASGVSGSSHTERVSMGFYTLVNSTQLSLLYSASTSWGTNAGNAGQSGSFAGYRWLTFHSSQFSNSAGAATTPSFSQTQYWLALWARSSNAWSFSFHGMSHFVHTSVRSGFMSVASNSATTQGWYPFNGNYSVSFSTAMPNSLAASDINKTGATAVANFFPNLIFNNWGSNIV